MSVKIVTHKGTSIHEEEFTSPKWAGEEYQEEYKKKMAAVPYETIISTKRGTGRVMLSEYPLVRKFSPRKGLVISTARGTATRIL